MSRQCPKCQANNPSNSMFCAECGTDLRIASAQAQSAVPGPAQTPNNIPGPSQPTYVYGGNPPQPNNVPGPSQPPNNVPGPSQPTYVYGANQPQPSQNTPPGPSQPPNNVPGPSQPTYVYGSNQSQQNKVPGPSQPTYVYSGSAQAQSNVPQTPPNNPYAPQQNIPYAQPNNPYAARPNTPYISPPNNQFGPNRPMLSTQTGKTNTGLVITIIIIVIVVVIGIAMLENQPKSFSTPTPDNQSFLLTPGATGSVRATSTTNLLDPSGNQTVIVIRTNSVANPTTAPPTNTVRPTATRPPIPTATSQPNFTPVKGPANFQLDLSGTSKSTIKGFDPRLTLSDMWAEATFFTPYNATAQVGWDYGFIFRDSSAGAYIVTVSSLSRWALTRFNTTTNQYTLVSDGPLTNLGMNFDNPNTLDVVVQGNQAFLNVNGVPVGGTLNVSDVTAPGDVEVISGFFTGDSPPNQTTFVDNFVVAVKK